jgi:hypothetical protein
MAKKIRTDSWSSVTPNAYRRALTAERDVNCVQRLHNFICPIYYDIVHKRAPVDPLYGIDFQPLYVREGRRDMPRKATLPMPRSRSLFPQRLGAKVYVELRNST